LSVGRFASYNLLGEIIPQLVTLVTIPMYLHLVGTERFGILSLSWLLLGYFGLFDLGLGRATSFRISMQRDAEPSERAETFWSALLVNVGMGLIGGVVLWFAGDWFFRSIFKVDEAMRPEILESMVLLALSLPIATLTGVLTGSLQAREKFLETNKVSVISTILFQIFPLIVAWYYGPRLIWLLAAAFVARGLALVVLWSYCHKELISGQPVRVGKESIKALLGYGGWISLNAMIGPVLVMLDRFAIGAVLGAKFVAYYTVPFQIAKRLAILPTALTSAIFPRLAVASAEESRLLGEKALRTVNSIVTPLVVIAVLFIEPFIQLWVNKELATVSGPIGRVLLIGFWANALAIVPINRIMASGRPAAVTRLYLIQIPIYLPLLYLGMHYYGLMGAALALLVRLYMDFLLISWTADRRILGAAIAFESTIILTLAAFLSHFVSIWNPLWWGGAITLIAVSALQSWRHCPVDLRTRGLAMIQSRLNRKRAT
jgi:O-antigen/teichoic acid export membrane protein